MRQIITKGLASIFTDVPTLRPGSVEATPLLSHPPGLPR
jgi:hypothetical protein